MSDTVIRNPLPIRFPTQAELVAVIFRYWILVVLGLLAGLYWGVDELHSSTWMYPIQMRVTPAQPNATPSAANEAAALAGLDLNSGQGATVFHLYLDSLVSRNIADELAKDPKIMHTFFAGEWNETTQSWFESKPGFTARLKRLIMDRLGYPSWAWHPPDGEDLMTAMGSYVKVQEDPRRPYIATVYMTFPDRQFGVEFLGRVHEVADNVLRQKALKRTHDYIAYLTGVLAKTTVAEHRTAIALALSEQQRAEMVARSDSPFAAELFERPWAGTAPVEPRGTTTLAIFGFVGALAGSGLALLQWFATGRIRSLWTRQRKRRLPV